MASVLPSVKRVWVVQEGKNDYHSAEEFGEVHFITTSDFRSMQNSKQNSEVAADIRKFRTEYIANEDYIIPVGNPMVVALVTMALGGGNHKFLKWDGRKVAYIPFVLNPMMVR
jgi:hypothetical protein